MTELNPGWATLAAEGGNTHAATGAPATVAGPQTTGRFVLYDVWRAAKRWKWVMIGIIATALIAGLVLTLIATQLYTATARIEIAREPTNVTNVEGLDTSAQQMSSVEYYQTQYTLLAARTLATRVANSLRLASDRSFLDAFDLTGDGVLVADGRSTGAPTDAQRRNLTQQAVDLLLANVAITPVRGSSLVDIAFTSPNPQLSATIANEWTRQFVQGNFDRRYASTADARKLLENRLSDLRARLEQSEKDLVNYAANTGIVTLDTTTGADGQTTGGRTLTSSDLDALNTALAQATAERIQAESRSRQNGSSPTADSSAVAALRQSRAEAASEYARLMAQFEPGYPTAEALANKIESLDRSIAQQQSAQRGQVGGDVSRAAREARSREAELRTRVNTLKGDYLAQKRTSIQYNIYQREVDSNRTLYDGLLQRYKEIGVAGVEANEVSVVDPARVPNRPSSPNLPLNLAIALALGLTIAGATAFTLDQLDEGLKDPNRVAPLLGAPLLGVIPIVDEDEFLEQIADRKSDISDAYLSVQTSLSFSTEHGLPRTLLLTSTEAREGKSSSCVALARSMARTGRRVLLIDSDMRSPAIARLLGLPTGSGLSNVLAGEDDWRGMVREGPDGMRVMTTGPKPPNAAELLTGDRLAWLLAQAGEEFETILIDSSPVLGLADAPLIASRVEAVAFVCEADRVRVRAVQTALQRLRDAHARVAGVVLTKFDRAVGYDYAYGYGYGYGREVEAAEAT